MTTTAFVPRPIYRIHTLGYVVEQGDTPSRIAQKFGQHPGAYRDLVAANLHGRTLMPMALGSPYSSRTFATLAEGEVLRIPAHWPNPQTGMLGAPGTVGEQMLDPIAQAMAQAVAAVNAGSGNSYADWTAAMTNAAVQWWHNQMGTQPSGNPADYIPYVTAATAWINSIAIPQGLDPAQVASFPWGAFLAMLPAAFDPTQIDWANGGIPGTAGIPWSSIPWGYLSQIGTALETLKLPPVQWPTGDMSPASVLAAIQAAIQAAQALIGGAIGQNPGDSCGQSSHIATDLQCYCDPGYTWASAQGTNCVPQAGGPPKPGAQSCPTGSVFDAGAPGGAGCYTCSAGQAYNLSTHGCDCPPGTMFDVNVNQCLAPPKSQADCAMDPGTIYDPNGPSGPHCYTCDAPMVYSAQTHQCDCPAGQSWNGSACVAGGPPPGPVQKACPKGTTWNATSQVCVQDAIPTPTPKKDDDKKNALADDTTNKTLMYAMGGVILVALGAGGVYLATRPPAGATTKFVTKKGKK